MNTLLPCAALRLDLPFALRRGAWRPQRWPVLLLACAGVAAAQMPPDAVARGMAMAAEAARALAPPDARVQVLPGTLDPRLTLAPCSRVEPYLPAGVPPWGHTRIGLRCSDGARWNVLLPLTVQVWAPAMTAAAALPAGARLGSSQLVRATVDWAAAAGPAFATAELLSGRTLVRPLVAGQALRAADLQPRQWFARGDPVQIHAAGNGFAVSAEGEALAAGLEGQPVRVRTDGGRVLVGRPVGERRVEVAL